MNVIAIEYSPTTSRGGSERSYFDVLTGLKERGHEITLAYLQEGNLLHKYQAAGIKTVKIGTYMLRSGRKIKDLFLLTRAIWRLRGFSQAIVYTNFAEAFPLAACLKIIYKYKFVSHIRLNFHGSYSRQIKWAGKYMDQMIVINKMAKAEFEIEFNLPGRGSIIYNGITIPETLLEIKLKPKLKALRLLYLGRIAPEKGVSELVAVAAKLKAMKLFDFTLQITGSYIYSHSQNYQVELQELINGYGMESIIKFDLPVENPIEYVAQFDLFIFPSTWYEPFGRTVPEAILAGTPILARDVGMIAEIMMDNPDFIFDSDESLLKKIIQFYNAELKFNFESARSTVTQSFNKDRMIKQVETTLLSNWS